MAEIDVVFANQILNEVVNGFRIPRFEETLGATHTSARELLAKVHAAAVRRGGDTQTFIFSEEETRFFRRALLATLDELGEDEFETRTGYPLEEGQKKLAGLPE